MGCGNLLSGPNLNHRLETTICRPSAGKMKVSICSDRSGPLLENGLGRPENRYGRYGFASFFSFVSISISTVVLDGARVSL